MDATPDPLPDVIRIESSGSCNFRCVHCPTGQGMQKRKLLTPPMFSAIVGQLERERCIPRVAVLYHGGEPLLNRHLPDYIATLKGLGVKKTVITTNGSLLDAEIAERLVLAGLDELKVTFDGESSAESDAIRRNGDFLRDASHVKELCRIRGSLNRTNPVIRIGNIRLCDRATLDAMKQDGARCLSEVPRYILDFFADEQEQVTFSSYPAMQWPGYEPTPDIEVVRFPKRDLVYCDLLFETTTILSNGDVVPCCYDLNGEVVFGNVFEKSLVEIWQGERHTQFRSGFKSRSHPDVCRKCNVLSPRYLVWKNSKPVAAG